MLEGVEVYGGRGGGVGSVVGGVEVCGRAGGVWWPGLEVRGRQPR